MNIIKVDPTKQFGKDYGFVYGFKDTENGKIVIGSKTKGNPDNYITSLSPKSDFWQRYLNGKIRKYILAVLPVELTTAAEWCGLDYGMIFHKDKFYNLKNSAHKKNHDRVPEEVKENIYNFIKDEEFKDYTLNDSLPHVKVGDAIEDDFYPVMKMLTKDICEYDRHQVRSVLKNQDGVRIIAESIRSNPEKSAELFGAIVVVVMPNGDKVVNDGNTRLSAAEEAGLEYVPVVYVRWEEICDDPNDLRSNMELLGSYLNRESEIYRLPNSRTDYKRQFMNILAEQFPEFDISDFAHVERARYILTQNFSPMIPSAQRLSGLVKGFIRDCKKDYAEIKYQKNLLTYSKTDLKGNVWSFESKKVAAVTVTWDKLKFQHCLSYIQRRMKTTKYAKGAVIWHYSAKSQIDEEQEKDLVRETEELIEYHGLNITLHQLPVFDD